jgi:hypothetical protein
VTDQEASTIYPKSIKDSIFYTASDEIKSLMINTEKSLVDFEQAPRKDVMNRLRLPERRSMAPAHWAFGLLTGLSVHPLILVAAYAPSFSREIKDGRFIMQIYAGFSIPILFSLLFSLNVIIWQRYRVNFPFIMELNLRDHLRPTQFATICAVYLFIFAYASYFHIVRQVCML